MGKSIFISATFAMICLVSIPALGALTNGSFETGNLSGWTVYQGSPTVTAVFAFGGQTPSQGNYLAGTAGNGAPNSFGMYQRISWSGQNAEALVDVNTYQVGGVSDFVGVRIGIDPTGGTSQDSSAIVWSALTSHNRDLTWGVATAAADGIVSGYITIFVEVFMPHTTIPRPHGWSR